MLSWAAVCMRRAASLLFSLSQKRSWKIVLSAAGQAVSRRGEVGEVR